MKYVGKLDGLPVYTTAKKTIINGNWDFDIIYIITDDENKIFKNGYIIGKADGTLTKVQEYGGYSYKYKPSKVENEKEEVKQTKKEKEAEEINTNIDVDKILEDSRRITVKDLVGEFNYDTYQGF